MPYAAVVALFNEARACDYDEIAEPLTQLIRDRKARKLTADVFTGELEKVRKRFQEIQEIDYFQSTRGEDLRALFQKAESLGTQKKPETKARLRVEDFRGKTWMTRPRPEIDRVGSAWLILNLSTGTRNSSSPTRRQLLRSDTL